MGIFSFSGLGHKQADDLWRLDVSAVVFEMQRRVDLWEINIWKFYVVGMTADKILCIKFEFYSPFSQKKIQKSKFSPTQPFTWIWTIATKIDLISFNFSIFNFKSWIPILQIFYFNHRSSPSQDPKNRLLSTIQPTIAISAISLMLSPQSKAREEILWSSSTGSETQ